VLKQDAAEEEPQQLHKIFFGKERQSLFEIFQISQKEESLDFIEEDTSEKLGAAKLRKV